MILQAIPGKVLEIVDHSRTQIKLGRFRISLATGCYVKPYLCIARETAYFVQLSIVHLEFLFPLSWNMS